MDTVTNGIDTATTHTHYSKLTRPRHVCKAENIRHHKGTTGKTRDIIRV